MLFPLTDKSSVRYKCPIFPCWLEKLVSENICLFQLDKIIYKFGSGILIIYYLNFYYCNLRLKNKLEVHRQKP